MNRLEGKTAVVTGGGTNGIGRAAAARMVAEGAYVFITGRRESELNSAVAAIGRNVTAVPGDITNRPTSIDSTTGRTRGKGLDVLFANAGRRELRDVRDTTEKDLDEMFGVNVTGTVLTVKQAIPLLNPGASVIVNVSTSADRGVPGMGAYAASKAALRSFVRTWANELKDRDIRVNAISPGPTDTSGVAELVGART